jgi:hypothetical protein
MINLAVAVIVLDKPSFEPVKVVVVVKVVVQHVTETPFQSLKVKHDVLITTQQCIFAC